MCAYTRVVFNKQICRSYTSRGKTQNNEQNREPDACSEEAEVEKMMERQKTRANKQTKKIKKLQRQGTENKAFWKIRRTHQT